MRIRFLGELAGILTVRHEDGLVRLALERRAAIKDVVESLGVPHTEVYGIEADGALQGFGWIAGQGAEVVVRPATPPVDVTVPTALRPEPLARLAFAVDENVAKLAVLLRVLGFDALWDRELSDPELAALAASQGRVVLSRDRSLLKRRRVSYGRLIRAVDPEGQLREVLDLFGVRRPPALFRRCVRCNLPLSPVAKQDVLHRLEPKTRKYFHEFHICGGCQRVYWAGSHHDRLLERLAAMGIEAGD